MTHRVDDDTMVTPALLRAFIHISEQEGGNGQHFAVMEQMTGEILEHNPHSPELEPMQALFATDIVKRLNRELHHDGVWLVLFTHPGQVATLLQSAAEYSRFTLIWLDRDGDMHINIEWVCGESDELDFSDVLMSGIESWLDRAEQAWQMWKLMSVDMIDAKKQKSVMLAKGEAFSPKIH